MIGFLVALTYVLQACGVVGLVVGLLLLVVARD